MQVTIPEKLIKRIGWKMVGLKTQQFEEVVEEALIKWAEETQPEIYIGTTPAGMSFEIPEGRIKDFLILLGMHLGHEKISIYYGRNNNSGRINCSPNRFVQEIKKIEDFIGDSSLMIEFDQATLYSGGGGCFSLDVILNDQEKKELAEELMSLLDFDVSLEEKGFHIMVRDKRLEVRQ